MPLRWRPFLAAMLAAGLVWWWGPEHTHVRTGLAITLFIGVLWLTEAIDITFTALLIPVLAILSGLMPAKAALAEFARLPVFEDHNLVNAGNRRQAMGDDDRSTAGEQAVDGALDALLGSRVQA